VTPRTLTALLAEQPEELLADMLANVRSQIAALQREADMLDEALQKKTRKPRRANADSRKTGVKREDVLTLMRLRNAPVNAEDVREAIREALGVDLTASAARNHLRRLVSDGKAIMTPDGKFLAVYEPSSSVPGIEQPDLLSRDGLAHSQETRVLADPGG